MKKVLSLVLLLVLCVSMGLATVSCASQNAQSDAVAAEDVDKAPAAVGFRRSEPATYHHERL